MSELKDVLNAIFGAPLATVLVLAGVIFLAVAVVGDISGKISPGRNGRIAAGVIGAALFGIGFLIRTPGSTTSDGPPVTTTPYSPAVGYEKVRLESLPGARGDRPLGLAEGEHYDEDRVPFVTGWAITTRCADRVLESNVIDLPVSVSQPVSVYLVFHASWARIQYDSREVGSVVLRFAGGHTLTEGLVLGYNIRDWVREDANAVTTVRSDRIHQVHAGTNENGLRGRLDMLRIDVPSQFQSDRLLTVQINDLSEFPDKVNAVDPCIEVKAITVRHRL